MTPARPLPVPDLIKPTGHAAQATGTGGHPRFGLDGAEYEIDLSTTNATAFREQLAPFTARARKAGRGRAAVPGAAHQAVSAAARSGRGPKNQGITVSDRGRIPASVIEQYQAAARGP